MCQQEFSQTVKSFSERLVAARKRAGYTQEGLAKELNVSKGAVGNWESGRNEPRPEQLRRLCEILNFNPENSQDSSSEEFQHSVRRSVFESTSGVLGVLSDEGLKRSMEDIAGQLREADNELRGQLMRALGEIDEEIRRRGEGVARAGAAGGEPARRARGTDPAEPEK